MAKTKTQMISEVMTRQPITVEATTMLDECARLMKDSDVGDVIVMKDGSVCGIVTDRDITIRAIAEGKDPKQVRAGDICSSDLVTLSPNDSVEDAVRCMREKAIRRIPITEGGTVVGIVSLGDLAQEKDPKSALADISSAPPSD